DPSELRRRWATGDVRELHGDPELRPHLPLAGPVRSRDRGWNLPVRSLGRNEREPLASLRKHDEAGKGRIRPRCGVCGPRHLIGYGRKGGGPVEATYDRTREILESKSLHRPGLTDEELAAVTQEHRALMDQRIRTRREDLIARRLLPWRRFWESIESTQDGAKLARMIREDRQRSILPSSSP